MDSNSELFFKLWRNRVIRLRIFYHLNIFYCHIPSKELSIHELRLYQFKDYIQNLVLNDQEFYKGKVDLPLNVERLSLKNFNEEIVNKGWLDGNKKLTHLDFGRNYNHPLKIGDIPDGITNLTLSISMDCQIEPNVIPSSVTSITFGSRWNLQLQKDSLPNSLKSLKFGTCYNNQGKPLDLSNFPKSIESLIFGRDFQQIIEPGSFEKYLPNLKKLEINSDYKLKLKPNTIPKTVEEFFYGYNNDYISRLILPTAISSLTSRDEVFTFECVPNGVRKLMLGDHLSNPIGPNALPNSITDLSLGLNNSLTVGSIPKSVTSLDFFSFNRSMPDGTLPSSLVKIKFGQDFNQELSSGLFKNCFESLTSLDLGYFCRRFKSGILPKNLKVLKFNRLFNPDYLEPNSIPDSVETLQIMPNFKYHNDNNNNNNNNNNNSNKDNFYSNIPKSLKNLILINFNDIIPRDYFRNSDILWNQLKELDLSESHFNSIIHEGCLPLNLEVLKLSSEFNQDFTFGMLPPNLKTLHLGSKFNKIICRDNMPLSLTTLWVLGLPKLSFDDLPINLVSIFTYNTNKEFLKSLDCDYFWYLKIVTPKY
ncbi:hypothetical protein RB653_001894 [Dictyostelium firmibasis]|uniref:FNIP repeat-containing protein n=1 Tax=Dictyostelium firmibasis TaxID=79012 RepID=A0AAN7TVI1_9MYCE